MYYANEYGMMTNNEYPYTASDGACAFSQPSVTFDATQIEAIDGNGYTSSIETIVDKLS